MLFENERINANKFLIAVINKLLSAVAHYSSPAEHVLSGDHHHDPEGPSTYEIAIGVDQNISQIFSNLLHDNSSLDIAKMGLDATGVIADEIMNSCRRKSMIGQVLQRVGSNPRTHRFF